MSNTVSKARKFIPHTGKLVAMAYDGVAHRMTMSLTTAIKAFDPFQGPSQLACWIEIYEEGKALSEISESF